MRGGLLLLLLPLLACSGAADDATVPPAADAVKTAPPSGPTPEGPAPAPTAAPEPPAAAAELAVHALANLGDSISQGFAADDSKPLDLGVVAENPGSIFHDEPALSWVQGTDPRVGSIAAHYRARDPGLVLTPLSRSGAELVGKTGSVPNLEKQARAIATTGARPDLVLVLLGGNDVCNRRPSTTADATATMYTLDEWRAAIDRGLTALADVLGEGATVRFVSMPRVDLLPEQVGAAPVPIVFGGFATSTTCQELWTISAAEGRPGICKIVTTEASAERRAAIGKRIDDYNAALAEAVRRMSGDAKKNPKKIAFQSDWHGALGAGGAKNASGGTFVYEPKHVGRLDCFHPSIEGQKALASLARTATWD
jgi:lysophospholipase L1-like esterase